MSRTNVNDMMAAAFVKWAKHSPFTFERVSRSERVRALIIVQSAQLIEFSRVKLLVLQPDIRIDFKPIGKSTYGTMSLVKCPEGKVLDNGGVDITFSSEKNWTDIYARGRLNSIRMVLYCSSSIMEANLDAY